MNFQEKLNRAVTKNNSLLCVGLDPKLDQIPQEYKSKNTFFTFTKFIVDQTKDLICAYKPNFAFFESEGIDGLSQLKKTIEYIKKVAPNIPIILDAKRSDIGNTAEAYSKAIFDFWQADGVTINPYMGFDSLEPFLRFKDKGIFVLCRTSNPYAGDFQDLIAEGEPLYVKVARKSLIWNKKFGNVSLVVGATSPGELSKLRQIAAGLTFLVPGIGAQGGDLKNTLINGLRKDGKGLIISASRSIIYDQDPRTAAQKLRDEINKYRKNI